MNSGLSIGFAGMTHLGVCHSVGCASLGVYTIGYDEDKSTIQNLSSGELGISEPDLLGLFRKSKNNIMFSADIEELQNCDIVFISSDVPTDHNGISSLTEIYTLINKIFSIM